MYLRNALKKNEHLVFQLGQVVWVISLQNPRDHHTISIYGHVRFRVIFSFVIVQVQTWLPLFLMTLCMPKWEYHLFVKQ